MPIPLETDLALDVAQIKSYVSLYRNGSLPLEILIAALFRITSGGGGGGGTSDATAANQATEIARLTEIRDRLVASSGRLLVQDQAPIIITSVETIPTVTTTSSVILAANALRKDAIIINNSSVNIFVSRSATATLNRGIFLRAGGGFYEIDSRNLYQGVLSAIASSAGSLLVMEGS